MMRFSWLTVAALTAASIGVASPALATPVYWNLFNIEDEHLLDAVYVTYASFEDMLNDTDRTGTFTPDDGGASANVVDSGSDGSTYWSLFNIEGEDQLDAIYVTYATLDDMLNDANRAGTFTPDGGGASVNLVGSGSDGSIYWSLFNIEGEGMLDAVYVTYATLDDMLNDTNRTGTFTPDGGGASANVVDGGSDGSIYWSLFNIEGEAFLDAVFVTYATLDDMLHDTNRTGMFMPDGGNAGANIVGSGAFVTDSTVPIPEPTTLSLLALGLGCLGLAGWRRAAA